MHTITKCIMKDEHGVKAQVLTGICHPGSAFMVASRNICSVINTRGLKLASASLNTNLQYHCNPSLIFFFLLVKQLLLDRCVV